MQQRESLRVEVLTVPECSSAGPTVEMIEDVASDLKVPVEITETVIDSQQEADRRRFVGSPTVLVEGIDIDAPHHGPATPRYGLT